MTREERIAYLQQIGVGYDSTVNDIADDDEFIHRSQRRAAPGVGSDGQRTEAAHGWDGSTRADSAVTDEHGNQVDISGAIKPYEGGWLPASDVMGRPVGNNRAGVSDGYDNHGDFAHSLPGSPTPIRPYFDDPSAPGRNRAGTNIDTVSPLHGYEAVAPMNYYDLYDPVYPIDYTTGRPMGGPVRASDMARGRR